MSLKTIEFQDTYWSGENNLIDDFYVPCLKQSVEYDRAVGYFSSSILCYIANGLYNFISNGGRMRIICSVNISEQDQKDIELGYDIRDKISNILDDEVDRFLSVNIINVKNLCWLIKENRLDIRVCLRNDDSSIVGRLFHEKFGLFKDDQGNAVSFLGSINETISGWLGNEESFEVSVSWNPALEKRVIDKAERFNSLWNGTALNVQTYSFPEAVKEKLIKNAPTEPIDYIYRISAGIHQAFKPRECQDEAKDAFIGNDFSCLFMMATGSGKTKAAMYAISQIDVWRLLLICVPSMELVEQWEGDVRLFYPDLRVIKCSSAYPESRELLRALVRARFPDRTVVICVYDSAVKDFYMHKWNSIKAEYFALICDEVHNMGAKSTQRLMELQPRYRIGLSATPKRNFDEEGSQKIIDYYSGNCYEFSIRDAQRKQYLVEYEYHLMPCQMKEEDWEEYTEWTDKIKIYRRTLQRDLEEEDKQSCENKLEKALRERAKLLKKCDSKLATLPEIFEMIPSNARTLIYGEDLSHLEAIGQVLNQMEVRYFEYVGVLNSRTERPTILEEFRRGIRKTLLAVGCLDEGIDIPACDAAVFISSSTSERQFIQRRGRVLRTAPNKTKAYIFDYLVYPKLPSYVSDDERKTALDMIEAQYRRIKIMMDDAINGVQEQIRIENFLSTLRLNPFEY